MKQVIYLMFVLIPIVAEAALSVEKPKVIAEEILLKSDSRRVLAPARVDAKIQTQVTADIEGHVVQINKPLGAQVKAGDVVLFVENKDPGFTYAKVPVRSPVTGIVSQLVPAQMGKVHRGDALFSVINPKSLKISTELAALDASSLRPSQKGQFKFGPEAYEVEIVGLSPLVDPRTGTATAELQFLPVVKGNALLPGIGTVGQVSFEIALGNVLTVPESALMYRDGKPLVRILKAGSGGFEKKAIELGEQRQDRFVVKQGIANGDKVIVRSSRPLKDGEPVEIEGTEPKEQNKKSQ